ncbi:hypothetical protein IWQ61_010279 [Dispira simplex]|nr:hypothetical protein IWQ61_010279 [Dispira simplex]
MALASSYTEFFRKMGQQNFFEVFSTELLYEFIEKKLRLALEGQEEVHKLINVTYSELTSDEKGMVFPMFWAAERSQPNALIGAIDYIISIDNPDHHYIRWYNTTYGDYYKSTGPNQELYNSFLSEESIPTGVYEYLIQAYMMYLVSQKDTQGIRNLGTHLRKYYVDSKRCSTLFFFTAHNQPKFSFHLLKPLQVECHHVLMHIKVQWFTPEETDLFETFLNSADWEGIDWEEHFLPEGKTKLKDGPYNIFTQAHTGKQPFIPLLEAYYHARLGTIKK